MRKNALADTVNLLRHDERGAHRVRQDFVACSAQQNHDARSAHRCSVRTVREGGVPGGHAGERSAVVCAAVAGFSSHLSRRLDHRQRHRHRQRVLHRRRQAASPGQAGLLCDLVDTAKAGRGAAAAAAAAAATARGAGRGRRCRYRRVAVAPAAPVVVPQALGRGHGDTAELAAHRVGQVGAAGVSQQDHDAHSDHGCSPRTVW